MRRHEGMDTEAEASSQKLRGNMKRIPVAVAALTAVAVLSMGPGFCGVTGTASAGVLQGAGPRSSPRAHADIDEEGYWRQGFGNPEREGLDGPVRSVCVYNGGLCIAGEFLHVGSLQVDRIASWDGGTWRTVGSGFDDTVETIVEFRRYPGESAVLYAAGSFTSASGGPCPRLAQWNGVRWIRATPSFEARTVQAALTSADTLFIAGSFSRINNVGANNVALQCHNYWYALSTGLTGSEGTTSVRMLARWNGKLVAAGSFTRAGNVGVRGCALWNGTSWSRLDTPFGERIAALCEHEGSLVAAGWDSVTAGYEVQSLSSFPGSSEPDPATGWTRLGSADGEIFTLLSRGGRLYAGGDFETINGSPTGHAAVWDGAAWEDLAGGPAGIPHILFSYSDPGGPNLLVAAAEMSPGTTGKSRPASASWSLLAWDESSWQPLTPNQKGLNRTVNDFATYEGRLIVAGDFTKAWNTSANYIARWDGDSWTTLTDEERGRNGTDGPITAVLPFKGNLVVAGRFEHAGGRVATGLARWSGAVWAPFPQALGGAIQDLAEYDGELIAAGRFFGAGSPPAVNVARWDGSVWSGLGSGLGDDTDSTQSVKILALYKGRLIAGGRFGLAGGTAANNIAAWDGTRWSPLGSGIGPEGATVEALTVRDSLLIVGGEFSQAGDTVAHNLAAWNGISWRPFAWSPALDSTGVPEPVEPDRTVLALASYAGSLFATGRFTRMGSQPISGIARWDGANWSAVGEVGGEVSRLFVSGDDLVLGGPFVTAGGLPSFHIAFRHEPYVTSTLFGSAVVGDTLTRTVVIANPDTSAARLSGLTPPSAPFLLTSTFEDSILAGEVLVAAGSQVHTNVLFAPAAPGSFSSDAVILMGSTPHHLLLGGEARELPIQCAYREQLDPTGRLVAGQGFLVCASVGDSIPADSVRLCYGPGGGGDSARLPMEPHPGPSGVPSADPSADPHRDQPRVSYEGTVPGEEIGLRGIEFHLEILAGRARIRYPAVGSVHLSATIDSLAFPRSQPADVYAIISFPLELSERSSMLNALLDDLGWPDVTAWRMFGAGPDGSDLKELTQSEDRLAQGAGYWLDTRRPVQLDLTHGAGTSTPTDQPFPIDLRPGWNLIGDPFAFPVDWREVRMVAAGETLPVVETIHEDSLLIEAPYAWDAGAHAYRGQQEILRPFEGYCLANRGSQAVRLLVPPIEGGAGGSPGMGGDAPAQAGVRGRAPAQADPTGSWSIGIAARAGSFRDLENSIGVSPEASAGFDRLDRSEPPPPPDSWVSLYIQHGSAPDVSRAWRQRWASDIRPRFSWSETWFLDVAAGPGATDGWVDLEFEGLDGVPAGFSVILTDRELYREVDLRGRSAYRFLLRNREYVEGPSDCRFALTVYAPGQAEPGTSAGLPERTMLGIVWPNPARGPVSVRYQIAAASRVDVSVIGVDGSRIRGIEHTVRPAGFYETFWDGRMESGQAAPSGIYFLRLRVDSGIWSRKILVAR